MTDIVFLTDIHGNTEAALAAFKTEDPDYIILGGDITDLGQSLDGVIPFIDELPAPTFAVPGNCDMRDILKVLDASSAVCLHHKTMDLGDLTIAGFGGANPSPFSTPFEDDEETIAKAATETLAKMKKNRWNILVTHAPPYGVLDEVGPDVHVGCHAMADIADKFDIICCGHIHEMKGTATLKNAICVNPGPAKEGNYAVIHLSEDSDPVIELKNIRDGE
ncbi:MAG TPA: metallophosphoesterase [Methanocorpusculum sp.]|nr:metallophosphoesterase [Methanocorpusculum sp.]